MPIELQPLSMMDLRSKPGEVLDDVARDGRAFVIERNGQQRACLVPISFFLPDIETNRVAYELDRLNERDEKFRITITDAREIQLLFPKKGKKENIAIAVTLPHGYPNKSPVVTANPIDEGCPHRWHDGSLCILGAMDTWNPGKHDIGHVLDLICQWLASYSKWQQSGEWSNE